MPIFAAIRTGSIDEVRKRLEENPKFVNARDEPGFSPLHWAVIGDHQEIAELLIQNGADVNARNKAGGITPLFLATNVPMAKLLIQNGADVNIRDNANRTPLHRAAWEGFVDIAKLLLENGAEANARDRNNQTPMDLAIESGCDAMIALLQEYNKPNKPVSGI